MGKFLAYSWTALLAILIASPSFFAIAGILYLCMYVFGLMGMVFVWSWKLVFVIWIVVCLMFFIFDGLREKGEHDVNA